MSTLLIDDQGNIVRPTAALAKRLGTWMQGENLADFLVRNLGYVALTVRSGAATFQFRPAKVSPIALIAGIQQFYDLGAPCIWIAWHDEIWHRQNFLSCNLAIQRIADLAAVEHARTRAADFISRPRKRQHLTDANPQKLILDAWSAGVVSVERLLQLQLPGPNRYIVVSAEAQGAQSYIISSGGSFGLLRRWVSSEERIDIANMPDLEYGRWAAQAYREAWRSQLPRLEILDCNVRWPLHGHVREAYCRLILPCATASGSQVLLGVMQTDANIDLRAQVH
jgi:hypothetical protein